MQSHGIENVESSYPGLEFFDNMHYSLPSWFTNIFNGLSIRFLIHYLLYVTQILLHLHLSYFYVNLYVLS